MSRTGSAWLLGIATLVIACGASDVVPDDRFGPRDGWPAEVAARTVGDGVVSGVSRLRTGDDGEVYALRREQSDWLSYEPRSMASVITRHAAGGSVLATIDGAGDLLVDFVVHPGGELTTLALRPIGGDDRYNVVLARRGRDGATLFERALDDEASEHDRQAYTVTESTLASQTLAPRLEDGRTVFNGTLWLYFQLEFRLTLVDGVVYLTAPIYGLRIYRLSDQLVPAWASTVEPLSDQVLLGSEPQITADRDGAVWVALLTDDGALRVLEAHFGTTISPHPTTSAVLLSQLDAATGALRTMTVIDGPGGDDVIGLRVDAGIATLVGRSRIRKYDRPNDTTEWDVFVAHASATEMIDYRAIDVQREDFAYAASFLDTGEIVVTGTFDFLQVDTNSWVENGAGLVLVLDRDGAPLRHSALRGPRHVEVNACAAAGDVLYVGGKLDSYITHTCDGDRSGAQCYSHAFVGRLSLSPEALD